MNWYPGFERYFRADAPIPKRLQKLLDRHKPKTASAALRVRGIGRKSVRLLCERGLIKNDLVWTGLWSTKHD